MSSTYISLHYHVVFSTKNRVPCIAPQWRGELHRYLSGTVKGLDGFVVQVDGVDDHVHLLVSLTQNHCLADFMRELKKSASGWVHDTVGLRTFAWQEGYAAFTVSPTGRAAVKSYINNQEQHHYRKSFVEELKELLQKAEVEYDPKYLE